MANNKNSITYRIVIDYEHMIELARAYQELDEATEDWPHLQEYKDRMIEAILNLDAKNITK